MMKYITDTTVKDVNTLTFIINVFNADMEENDEYKFVFTSTKQNYIIKQFINGNLQRVHSYTVEEFNKQYSYTSYMLGVLDVCNADDYDLSGII